MAKKVTIVPDTEILQAIFRDPRAQRQIASRVGRVAKEIRSTRMAYDNPGYFFEAKKPEERGGPAYRDKRAIHFDRSLMIRKGIIAIRSDAPSAYYVEKGNAAKGETIFPKTKKSLKIPVKIGKFIYLKTVKTNRYHVSEFGRGPLERAIRRHFR